jgi:hypothetical protein
MQIVFAFGARVNHSGEVGQARRIVVGVQCPVCQAEGHLVRHGVYWRKGRDGERVYRIPIQRWLCKTCQHTLSALPDFFLRSRWYLLSVVSEALLARGETGASWRALQLTTRGAPHLRTSQRWWRSLRQQAGRWLDAVQAFLAQQDSASPWLDAQGEAAQAATPLQALLGAAGHLLAWAQSRWTPLAGYGWNDRLHFVWLWGSEQGLGRLV